MAELEIPKNKPDEEIEEDEKAKLDKEIKEKKEKQHFLIDSLENRDAIKELLREYESLVKQKEQSGLDDEVEKDGLEYIQNVLKRLDIKGYISKEKDPYGRWLGYQYLADIGTKDNILFLLNSIKDDSNSDNKNHIIRILCRKDIGDEEIARTVLEMIDDPGIEKNSLFMIIGSTFKTPEGIIRALHKVREHYLPKRKFFVGYEFPQDKKEEDAELRRAIDEVLDEEGLKNRLLLTPLSAIKGNLLEKIYQAIKNTEFGIYDLSKSAKESIGEAPNPNVILEVGIARGLNKNFYVLVKKGIDIGKVLSDLSGEIRNKYNNYSELKEKLRKIFKEEKSLL